MRTTTMCRSVLLPAGLLLLAGAAPAQVSLFDWPSAGSSTGSGSQTPTTLMITGPDNGCDSPIAYFEATAPVGGTVSITCDFQNLDTGALQDHPIYDAPAAYLNGEILVAAFDGILCAAGYNTFHEVMTLSEAPVLFVPGTDVRLDDQGA